MADYLLNHILTLKAAFYLAMILLFAFTVIIRKRFSLFFFFLIIIITFPNLLFFLFFRAALVAYGGSQDWGPIGATTAGLHHSHTNMGSELNLQPTPQPTATRDP